MSQQWLSVVGIAFDAVGFVILLVEWWLAFFNEEQQLGFQRRLEQQRNHRAFAQAHAPDTLRKHLEVSGKMMDDMALRQAWEAHAGTLVRRKAAFVAAAFLIVVGAALQMAGSWPGCCPSWNVTPG